MLGTPAGVAGRESTSGLKSSFNPQRLAWLRFLGQKQFNAFTHQIGKGSFLLNSELPKSADLFFRQLDLGAYHSYTMM